MDNLIIYLLLFASAIIGGAIVLVFKIENTSWLKLILSFSGAFLLSISILHLLPEVYAIGNSSIGYYILLGFVIQIILEQFSRGIEHGHFHVHDNQAGLPIGIMLSLCVHSLLEGLPLSHDHGDGHNVSVNSLLIGIVLHKIPAAFALMSVLTHNKVSRNTMYLLLFIFACMSPLGVALNDFLGSELGLNTEIYMARILALVLGLLLHISTTILFESSDNHRFGFIKIVSILLGLGMGMLTIH